MAFSLVMQVAQQLMNPRAGDVLKLNASEWLDMGPHLCNELYMRRCYPDLIVAMRNHRQSLQFADGDNGTVIFTGTPGTHLPSNPSFSARQMSLLPFQAMRASQQSIMWRLGLPLLTK